jgi:uncharacterized surface protein with fasciclin (FAS1) repeats
MQDGKSSLDAARQVSLPGCMQPQPECSTRQGRTMKIYLQLLIAACSMAFGLPAQASDLIETASVSGGTKSFVEAAKTSGLSDSLKNKGPYTIFAPDDAAFAKLPAAERDALMKDKTKLAKILAYHVIPGTVKVADVKPGKVQTIEGDTLTLKSDNGKITVNEANVTQSDVTADNGVIHIIDKVVIPKE